MMAVMDIWIEIILISSPSFADIPGEFMLECGGMIADMDADSK